MAAFNLEPTPTYLAPRRMGINREEHEFASSHEGQKDCRAKTTFHTLAVKCPSLSSAVVMQRRWRLPCLHDVVEDTSTKLDDIKASFGEEVAKHWRVTKSLVVNSAQGSRQVSNLRKITSPWPRTGA